jgi:IS1 family transposase
MVTIALHCPRLRDAKLSYAMVMPLMANNCIAAIPADGKVARTRLPLPCAERADRWSLLPLGIGAGKTCQRLWEAIPEGYRQGHCFTDFWAAYRAVIPEEQHTAVGKETGETAHVERWNNTLRQRLARFVRMTLSFSKSVVMHEACLLLFLHRYNRERAILLK